MRTELLMGRPFRDSVLNTDGVGTLRPRCVSPAVFGSP